MAQRSAGNTSASRSNVKARSATTKSVKKPEKPAARKKVSASVSKPTRKPAAKKASGARSKVAAKKQASKTSSVRATGTTKKPATSRKPVTPSPRPKAVRQTKNAMRSSAMTQETTTKPLQAPHPGMMGDATEEQNLNQPGVPEARITKDEVETAFQGPKPEAE